MGYPRGKRLGLFDERIDQKRDQQFREHPDAQTLFGARRNVIEIEQRL